MPALYIHVPFCQKRCHYCSFYSTTHGKTERDAYTKALITEMAHRSTDAPVGTVYFGGGTPSQLDADELTAIFEALHRYYRIAQEAEITFECNPDDIVPATPLPYSLPELLASLGVNRVSMGVQSFHTSLLQRINRRHSSRQALEAIDAIHGAGIHNVSIDLIYGLPGQTMDDWQSDVDTAVQLLTTGKVSHLSSYCLSIEPGTHLYNMRTRGEISDAPEELTLQMYDYLVESMVRAGAEHYEISNFALPGYASRHNSSYWDGTPYIGLGPGAHSYDGVACRRWNLSDLHQYVQAPSTTYDEERLTEDERYDELIMTRLRTAQGLKLEEVARDRRAYLLRQARPYVDSGLMAAEQEGDRVRRLRLTRAGISVSDAIFADLMCDV